MTGGLAGQVVLNSRVSPQLTLAPADPVTFTLCISWRSCHMQNPNATAAAVADDK